MTKLTVAIITYNRSHYLVKMLDSVLAQTYKDFNAIIYDNGSTDNTAEVSKSYLKDKRFTYHKDTLNSRITNKDVFNQIIFDCGTDYLIILHDDDICLPTMFEKEIAVLEEYKNISLVSVNVNYIDSNDNIFKENVLKLNDDFIINSREFIDAYMEKYYIYFPTVMYRVAILKNTRTYIEYIQQCVSNDDYFFIKINQLPYGFYILNEVLFNYRRHEKQDSYNTSIYMSPFLKIPVYELLKNNNYNDITINKWINYVNRCIIRILYRSSNTHKDYKTIKHIIYLPKKPSFNIRIQIKLLLYSKYLYRIYRKIEYLLSN